ncbi:MAG: hypothetical protein JWN01_273 [Patescibacteria group bacterium]|nr:hypothetical protein [Patescibacteria group bacterium]
MVPESAVKKSTAGVAVQENGLPEGVKILPVNPDEPTAGPPVLAALESDEPGTPPVSEDVAGIIKPRSRINPLKAVSKSSDPKPTGEAKPKKRKAGRPKSGRLDVPRTIASAAPAPLPSAPKLAAAAPTPAGGPRRMSDIAPRGVHTRHAHVPAAAKATPAPQPSAPAPTVQKIRPFKKPHHAVHKVGVPPLHFGAVLTFSMRARMRPRLIVLASLGALSFAAAGAYGAWLLLTGGLSTMATRLSHGGPPLLIEATLLAVLYYIGRSVGQAAITYGVAREADQRPVPFTRQLGVGVNTFGRRLLLDLGFGLAELVLLAGMGALLVAGGGSWPVDTQLQIAAIFTAFLVLLYLLTALALSRGLAAVAIVLTQQTPVAAAKLGWRLFSHRFELLGLRFMSAALELILAVPLAALAIAFVLAAPPHWHWAVIAGVTILAWLAGALFGAGTATWWTALYRRLITVDQPDALVSLLSSRQPSDANRGALSLIVALTTLLVAAALALPWLKAF